MSSESEGAALTSDQADLRRKARRKLTPFHAVLQQAKVSGDTKNVWRCGSSECSDEMTTNTSLSKPPSWEFDFGDALTESSDDWVSCETDIKIKSRNKDYWD